MSRPRRLIPYSREVWETPDGDDLVLDRTAGEPGTPIVIALHGLEGSSYSVYVQGILALAARKGWRGVAMNFRSCARDPKDLSRMLWNRRPRLYHSGDTADFDFLVRMLAAQEPNAPLFAFGASLGGNVLAKWLGENPRQSAVAAAAVVSAPFDLAASGRHMEKGLGRWYTESFLASLRPKAIEAARRFPEAAGKIDLGRTRASKTFREFDDAANAPLHGFAGADDYYARASSLRLLPAIATPTLCLNARDDPFLPPETLDHARMIASPAIEFVTPDRGGHIGFVEGMAPWRPRYWAEERVINSFARHLPR
jgi:predicted alpha/beta-fold hydrolase